MKYLVIGHKFENLGRGGYHISKRFCDEHPEFCEFKEDIEIKKLEELKYRRIIFRTQVPSCYSISFDLKKLKSINHVFYLRNEYTHPHLNNCTNGFHYYHMNKVFNNYVPMITDFPVQEITQPQENCLGFYVRRWLAPDSYDRFIDILDRLPYKMNVAVMGDDEPEIRHHKNILHYNHTNDNVQFFSYITHYFYPTSKVFVDPFPHSVLEALQCGKKIIFPKIERNFKDGIDDIKDCIHWEETANNYISDKPDCNKNHPFKAKLWKKFYKKIFDHNWTYNLCRSKYNNMYQFIQQEVI
jgi:hypothetical protein